MKKLSIIMSGILASLFFLTVFFSMGNENYKTVINFNGYFKTIDLTKEKGIQILIDDQQVENKGFQQYLYNVFKKYNVTAIGVSQYLGTETQRNICYVYADKDIYKNQFSTEQNERIQFSDEEENRYYTINKDDKNAVLLDFLNPMYYSFSTPYELHPFHQAIGNRMPVLLNISGIEREQFTKAISKSEYRKYILEVNDLDEGLISFTNIGEGIQFKSEKLMYICVVLAFVSLMMLIIVQTIKHKKYIAVAKLNGISKARIIKKVFLPYLISVFLAYSLVLFILLYLVSGTYREVNKGLYHVMILSIIAFFILMIVLMLLLYVYLWLYVNFHDLKQNKMNTISININILVKIIMTSLLMLPFVTLASDTYTQSKDTISMYRMRNESKNRYIISVFDDNKDMMEDEKLTAAIYTLISEKYNAKGYGLLNWFIRYDSNTEDEINRYEIPLAIVNRNYLKDYDLYEYDTKKKIDIESLHGGVFIVPKSHEKSESLKNYKNELYTSKVIIAKDIKENLNSPYFLDISLLSKYSKNPIIYVCDEEIPETLTWGLSMYVDSTDLSNLTKDLKETGYAANVVTQSLLPAVELEFNKNLVTFTTMIFMMIGYLVVYLTFVYQSIFVYLDVYRKKLSVQYLHGYSYTKRYTEIYTINACAYVLAGVIAYAVFHVNIKDIVLYILFFGGIEILFEAYQIRRFERKSGIRSLK